VPAYAEQNTLPLTSPITFAAFEMRALMSRTMWSAQDLASPSHTPHSSSWPLRGRAAAV
jgi:hypothetical protein